MTTQQPIRALTGEIPSDSIMRGDGSMWSHAATLGARVKGTGFTIDRPMVENFIRVFTTGYPQKVPVDYEHGTTNGATDFGQPVPKAGDVLEMKGVFTEADFEGDLKEAAQKLCAKATENRRIGDARNLGLWIRWRPTARALRMISDREYSELSITFFNDLPHNTTGEGQGPAIVAIALTNLPFLDDMLPVAASRNGSPPAGPAPTEVTRMSKFMSSLSALFGKPVGTEDEAESVIKTAVAERDTEITQLRQHKSFSDVVSAEIGETDPAKAAIAIRELKQKATSAVTASEEATQKANELAADKILSDNEKRIGTVALKAHFRTQILEELKAGKKAGETDTEKVIGSLPEATSLTQRSRTDTGVNAPTDRDSLINERANALMAERPELKAMVDKGDEGKAFKRALQIASTEIPRVAVKQ